MSDIVETKVEQPKTVQDYVRLYLTGIAMGSADTVPGVSGGTMAFITGIYGSLLSAITSFNLEAVQLLLRFKFKELLEHVPWRFLLVLFAGILTAVFTLARVVSWMMENQPVLLFSIFMGLVVGSAIAIVPKIKKWSPVTIVGLVAGTVFAFAVVGLVGVETSHDPLTLFLSGMAAIMAMILPGISGSSILLVLGQYSYVLNAVRNFDFVTLALVAMGAVVGLLGFSRVLKWLLKRYEQATISVLIGFVIGSLRAVWPWKTDYEAPASNVAPDFAAGETYIALVLILVGVVVVNLIDHFATGENPLFKHVWRRTPVVSAEPAEQSS